MNDVIGVALLYYVLSVFGFAPPLPHGHYR